MYPRGPNQLSQLNQYQQTDQLAVQLASQTEYEERRWKINRNSILSMAACLYDQYICGKEWCNCRYFIQSWKCPVWREPPVCRRRFVFVLRLSSVKLASYRYLAVPIDEAESEAISQYNQFTLAARRSWLLYNGHIDRYNQPAMAVAAIIITIINNNNNTSSRGPIATGR